MAQFTFGAGNARVILRAPLYLAGSLASRFVRRDPRLWVFGSGIGIGEGAKVLHDLASATLDDTKLVWLCSSAAELDAARELGMAAELKTGMRGFLLTLRARVVLITHGFGDVNRYAVRGALVVQLWHGIPLKKLHLDSPAALRIRFLPDHAVVRRLLGSLYRRAGRQISLFPAASALSGARLTTAFGLRNGVVAVTGDPRDDVLLRGYVADRRAFARAALAAAVGPLPPTVVLYAPTWRDGAVDPGVPTPEEWRAVAAWLEREDAVLLVRSHPLGQGEYSPGVAISQRIRMLPASRVADVTPLLSAVDVLVTDYSSIAYDFSLTERPIVFFAPDVDRYESSRGLYEHYRDFSGDTHVLDWAGVVSLLAGAGENPRLLAQSRRLRAEHFDLDDGHAAERVLAEILVRTGGAAPGSLVEASWAGASAHEASGLGVSGIGVSALGASTLGGSTPRVVIDSVELSPDPTPALVFRGQASAGAPTSVRLVGSRMRLEATFATEYDAPQAGGWQATIPLTISRWGCDGLAPASGHYRLEIDTADGSTSRVEVTAPVPADALLTLCRVSTSKEGGTLDVRFSAPLRARELGAQNQRALERRYRRGRGTGAEPSVFFESFYSQAVACNPRAIDARLAVERPDVTRYWSTIDASVAVPDGAIRVIEGSAEWWEARGAARLLVVNDWLRKRFRRRQGQRVLQTWHGTMLKRLALDRPGARVRARIAVLRERARWDILLSQNPHSTRVFRSAYRFQGEIWEEGYPRDDGIVTGDGAAMRARLGIAQDARVVLYAPTWRDDRTKLVDYLDLPAFAKELGDDTVTLVRGHSRTLHHGPDVEGSHVIDVTAYPDVADLQLIADVLVTDYSSIMFDFSATGKPIVFFTPDLAHYGDNLRGFYFDLIVDAPGAVTTTRDELVAALRAPDSAAYRARYERWRARFNPHDDGHASERVVRRILDAGLLD